MGAPLRVRVTTYNVLSSSLCEPDYYVRCAASDLAPKNRLKKIEAILDEECGKEAVVCLQEVSRAWVGPLQTMLADRGYATAYSLYGNKFNDYMGVAVAWPRRFRAARIEHLRLADTLPEPPREKTRQPSSVGAVVDQIASLFGLAKPEVKPFDVWAEVQRRHNVLVAVELVDQTKGDAFAVSTYHMPCLFGSVEKEQVMVVHAALAAKHTAQFANGLPFVLAGDFNIKPPDQAYAMLTDGALPDPDYAPPSQPFLPPNVDPFQPVVHPPLLSAYKLKLGDEPEFTNFAFTKYNTEPFVDTLDYIFLGNGSSSGSSSSWRVADVKTLQPKSSLDLDAASFPDNNQPSDHLLIAADLDLIPSSSS